jgi:hypothetical protein
MKLDCSEQAIIDSRSKYPELERCSWLESDWVARPGDLQLGNRFQKKYLIEAEYGSRVI